MGPIAELPIPQEGAAEPTPAATATPQQLDIENYTATSGAANRGMRGGFNQIGGMLNNLVGQIGSNLGLSEFAADRFKAADEYTQFADAVGAPVRDIDGIKDFNSFTQYVLGMGGQGLATSLPALGLAIGLRRPVGGIFMGSAPLEAGEQVGTLRRNPNVRQEDILQNSLIKGVVAGGIETLGGAPGQVARRILSPTKAVGGVLAGTGKAIVGESVTEGAQNLVGQALEQTLDPTKQIDVKEVLNDMAAGAAGGGGIGLAGNVAAVTPWALAKTVEELRTRLRPDRGPTDPDGIPGTLPTDERDVEKILSHVEAQGPELTKEYGTDDVEAQRQKFGAGRAEYVKTKIKSGFQRFVDAIDARLPKLGAGEKASMMQDRDPTDDLIHRRMMATLPADYLDNIGPELLLRTSARLRAMVADPKIRNDPRVQTTLAQLLGGQAQLEDQLKFATEAVYAAKSSKEKKAALDEVVASLQKRRETQDKQLGSVENIMRSLGRPGYIADPRKNEASLEVLAPQLVQFLQDDRFMGEGLDVRVKTTDEDFAAARAGRAEWASDTIAKMKEFFGSNFDEAMTRLEALAKGAPITSARAFESVNPRENVEAVEEGTPTETEEPTAPQGKPESPFLDPRVQATYATVAEAYGAIKGLKDTYHSKDVRFTPEQSDTGTWTIKAEAQDRVELTDKDWEDVRADETANPYRGVIKINTYSQKEGGGVTPTPMNLNVVKLTHKMMRGEKQQTGEGPAKYVRDMFARGISAVMGAQINTGRVNEHKEPIMRDRFRTGDLDFPDNLLVGYRGTRWDEEQQRRVPRAWTFGEIDRAFFNMNQKARELREAIDEAETPEARSKANRALNYYYSTIQDARERVGQLEDDAIAVFDETGDLEKALGPAKPKKSEMNGLLAHLEVATAKQNEEIKKLSKVKVTGFPKKFGPSKAQVEGAINDRKKLVAEMTRGGEVGMLTAAITRVEAHAEQSDKAMELDDRDFYESQTNEGTPDDEMFMKSNTLQGQTRAGVRTYEEDTGMSIGQQPAAGPKGPASGVLRGPDRAAVTKRYGEIRVELAELRTEETALVERATRLGKNATGGPRSTFGKLQTVRGKIAEQEGLLKRLKDYASGIGRGAPSSGMVKHAISRAEAQRRERTPERSFAPSVRKLPEPEEIPAKGRVKPDYEAKPVTRGARVTTGAPAMATPEEQNLVEPEGAAAAQRDLKYAVAHPQGELPLTKTGATGLSKRIGEAGGEAAVQKAAGMAAQKSAPSESLRPTERVTPEQRAKNESEATYNRRGQEMLDDGKFSMLNPKRGKITAAQLKAVEDELKKVLGSTIALKILDKMTFAGKSANIGGVETIMLASWAANVMDNGYHESVHVFMARLMQHDIKARNVLLRAASAPHIVARLNELLAKHPDALKQLTTKGQMELNSRRKTPLTEEQAEQEAAEERVAYMYQFWRLGKTGLLKVGPETENWLSKVKWFFRRIAAIWADDMVTAESVIKAGDILNAFRRGRFSDPNTVAEVMHERFPGDPRERMEKVFPSLARFMEKFVWTSTGAVRDMNQPALTRIMDKFYTPIDAKNMEPGFRQSRHVEFNKRMNQIFAILKPLSEAQRRNVLDDMRSGKARTLPASKKLEPILNELFEYMKTSGVMVQGVNAAGEKVYHPLRKIVENYFPRVPDVDYLMTAKGKEKFITLLEKYKYTDAEAIHANYVQGVNAGNPRESDAAIGLTFFTPQTNERTLTRIPEGELAPFLNKDLVSTLTQYVSRATRRAEYTRRFGNDGELIRKARDQATSEGMTVAQGRVFDESVQALEGTLGANMSDELKAVYGALMTYQNIRLLPLALFSSLVDPLGILVRGGTFGEATRALWRGLSDLVSVEKDSAFNLAATIGAINAAMDQEMMHDMYNSQYMPKTQQMINDMYFRFNGMESWNRSMRVAASAAAEQFIIRHAKNPNKHSARYMEELNLTADDVKLDHGKLVLNDKTRKALNTWVDQSILRPDAALRPIYMSDPNWMLVSHLKQYMYLYQKTIIARVVRELEHGNYSPMWALTMYVPMIIASDMARVLLTPGQGDDDSRKAWGAGDWLSRGVQRAGLFGPGQMAIDGWTDASYGKLGIESAAGPTAQQLLDFVRASAGHGDIGREVLRAIPGERLIR